MNAETFDAHDKEPASDVQGELVPFRLRPYRGESGFVAGTWLRSFQSAPAVRRVDPDEYYKQHARLVRAVIDRSQIVIAEHASETTSGSEHLLLGYVVGERDRFGSVVHYTYVKGFCRRQGIAAALWSRLLDELSRGGDDGAVRYTHSKSPFTDIAGKRGWQYSPYPAFCKGWD